MQRKAREDTRTKLTLTKPFFNILQTIIDFFKIQFTGSTNCSAVKKKLFYILKFNLLFIWFTTSSLLCCSVKQMTRSSVTSHVKVAPGHVIRPEIRRQGYITMSTVNCLNARRGGGRSRMFSPSDSRSGRGLGWSLALPIAYVAGAGIFVGRKEKIRGRAREGRKGEGASSLLRVFPSRGLEKKIIITGACYAGYSST